MCCLPLRWWARAHRDRPLIWGKEVWGEVLRHRWLKVGPEVRHSGYHYPSLKAILKKGKNRWQDWDRSGEALTAQALALDKTCSAPSISLSSCHTSHSSHTRVTPSSLNTWAISPQPGRRLLGMFFWSLKLSWSISLLLPLPSPYGIAPELQIMLP